eukprot:TRINITY_DN7461_c0_g1_i1.p1 TRINITY_DN7461_c0_g1~~TRINITY_DN7461_c0_g1_i1.p1  ORF type:complete len:237 (-),score=52.17 TRINITY_DN7461_c0_g1_i1:68-778(-)
MSTIQDLPRHLIHVYLSFLNTSDVLSLFQVSTTFYKFAKDDALWSVLYDTKWKEPPLEAENHPYPNAYLSYKHKTIFERKREFDINDPFFIVYRDVYCSLAKLERSFLAWQQVAGDVTKRTLVNELKDITEELKWEMIDMDETIKIIEKNPTKFKVPEWEMKLRKKLLDDAKETTDYVKFHIPSDISSFREESFDNYTFTTTSFDSEEDGMVDLLLSDSKHTNIKDQGICSNCVIL